MGIGYGSGEKRAEEAAMAAINSPLLEVSVNGAKGVLFSIAGNDDLTMFEIQDAAKIITESVDANAKIIFGTVRDEKLKKGEIKITVIASGFPENMVKKSLFGNDEDKKGKIFNTMSSKDKPEDTTPPSKKDSPAAKEEEEDDWGAVPAFLRRSKLK
jgi:cell division protein FtsZ